MRQWLRLTCCLVFLLLGCNRGSEPHFINRPAPDFKLQEDGRTVSLSSLQGKVVVLNFWATWCPPCVEELPSLLAMQAHLRDRVTVLAVNVDDDEAAYRKFSLEHHLGSMAIRDPQQYSNKLYGSFRFPETYIVDPHGILRRKFIGPVDWTRPDIVEYLTKL